MISKWMIKYKKYRIRKEEKRPNLRNLTNNLYWLVRSGPLQPLGVWRRTAWVFNVSKWKRPIVRRHLRMYNVRFLALNDNIYEKKMSIRISNRPIFIVWGRTTPLELEEFSLEFNIPIHHLEDGFFRSIGLGAGHVLPYSLCYDRSGIYYDSSRSSDLENILLTYNFEKNRKLIDLAKKCLEKIKDNKLTKYNEIKTGFAPFIYGPKVKKRVLILGQVEDDQSLLYGCEKIMNNSELIELVARENPDAQIIYKPHPDVLYGFRKEISNVEKHSSIVEILHLNLSLPDALHGVDRVYTLTSLAGFEALILGIPVTTLGAPFYSGWGVTDDRQTVARRSRSLTIEEIFAGAYILYPKYIDPENGSALTLDDTINIFLEKLSEIEVATPHKELTRLRAYNLNTQHRVDSRFLYNSIAGEISIITDSVDSLLIARGLANYKKRITVITTRDDLANNDLMLLSPEDSKYITVTSIHKKYSIPMSKIERNAVKLAEAFSENFKRALNEVSSQHLCLEIIDALGLGLEDFIYFECLRYFAVKEIINDYDNAIIILEDESKNLDLIKSFYFHGNNEQSLGKIYIKLRSGKEKTVLSELSETEQRVSTEYSRLGEMKTSFSELWWSLQNSVYNEYDGIKNHIAVCGNVSKNNYAYSPASLKLISSAFDHSGLPIVFYNSALMNISGQDEVKNLTLSENLSRCCTVYKGNLSHYKSKYPENILEKINFFNGPFSEYYYELLSQNLSVQFLDVFSPRLNKFIGLLFSHIVFIAEASQLMSQASLFATSMDRIYISRILAAIARKQAVPSIGVQPQIVSTSPRYKPPAVDRMGVIDTSQVETYQKLGAPIEKLYTVGSVNILSRLNQIEESINKSKDTQKNDFIFFAMQHSNSSSMISTAQALKKISLAYGYRVVVKPHPHQELPILNEVRDIFSDAPLVNVLNRNSDTYEHLAYCSVVVGLFSSVLFESALYGIPVIVAAFDELDDSVDFTQKGIAIKASNPEELETIIIDIFESGPNTIKLKEDQNEYLIKNPQFLPPYNSRYIDNFIATQINGEK